MAEQQSAASPQPEGKQSSTPLTPAQRLEVLQQKEKEIRKRLWQSALLALTAFIAICAVGIAWFVNNSRVTGSGVQVQTSGPPFELATEGDNALYTIADLPTGAPDTNAVSGHTLYSTTGSKTTITWMLSTENGFSAPLQPGSHGELSFWILPASAEQNLGTVNCTLSLTPYTDSGSSGGIPISSSSGQSSSMIYPLDRDKNAAVYTLLQGHLLFFQNKTNAGYYENLISDGTLSISVGTAPVLVKLYWVWPTEFSNYVLIGPGNLFDKTSSEAYVQLLKNMSISSGSYYNQYFYSATDYLEQVLISSTMGTEDRQKCSNYYNNADQLLGTKVRYLQLTLDATL